MNFSGYQNLKKSLLEKSAKECEQDKSIQPAPLVLAYLGDSIFTFYVRERLVLHQRNKVQVLNDVSSMCVSAVMQAKALDSINALLQEEELDIVRRGRNTKSSVPKSASVAEYRKSTGFECLLGWLYWKDDNQRLDFLMDRAFLAIMEKLGEKYL